MRSHDRRTFAKPARFDHRQTEQQLEAFVGAGNGVKEIAQGVSVVKDGADGGGHSSKLRA